MFKKIVRRSIIFFIGLVNLIGCNNFSIKIKEFITDKYSYELNDRINLKFSLEKSSNISILSVFINNEECEVEHLLEDNFYHVKKLYLMTEAQNQIFKITKVRYAKKNDKENFKLIDVKEKSTIAIFNENSSFIIILNEFSLENPKNEYYIEDTKNLNARIILTFDIAKIRGIKSFIINNKELTAQITIGNSNEYLAKLICEETFGEKTFELQGIKYFDELNNIQTLLFNSAKPTLIITILERSISITSVSVASAQSNQYYGKKSSGIHFLQINKVEEESVIKITMKINNPDNVIPKSVVIDNYEYSNISYTNSLNSETGITTTTINFNLSFNNSGDFTLTNFRVTYKIGLYNFMTSQNKTTIKVSVFDKVIKSFKDLLEINNNLSGRYILANDIDGSTYNNGQVITSLISNFSGIFDGNGKAIKNHKISVPLFNNILENSEVFNFEYRPSLFIATNDNVSVFANTNQGIIHKILLGGQLMINNNASNIELCGLVEENGYKGVIQNIEVKFDLIDYRSSKSKDIFVIMKINNGVLQKFINYTSNIISGSETKNIYLTTKINNGSILDGVIGTNLEPIKTGWNTNIYFLFESFTGSIERTFYFKSLYDKYIENVQYRSYSSEIIEAYKSLGIEGLIYLDNFNSQYVNHYETLISFNSSNKINDLTITGGASAEKNLFFSNMVFFSYSDWIYDDLGYTRLRLLS